MGSDLGASAVLALAGGTEAGTLRRAAAGLGVELVVVDRVADLLERLRGRSWLATLLSLSVENVDEALARRIGEEPGAGALILTAPRISFGRALTMQGAGAAALLPEPVNAEELGFRLDGLLDAGASIPLPDPGAREDPASSGSGDLIVGDSPAMAPLFETLARIGGSDATVLLTGESGTGKEVVARTLHRTGPRRGGPFVAVNCAAIPEHLLESELFGHERGAFTGAVARRVGRFERADGGTLFLDEVGDMSLVLQAKVLRVLEERTVERLGGEEEAAVDVRVIAATNQDLLEATREGRFREDLYFRLAVVELHLPPLRDRREDIRSLALHFAARFAKRHDRPVTALSERALRQLEAAAWPGNVRELRNVMDRAVLMTRDSTIRSGDLRLGHASPRAPAPSVTAPAGYPATASLEEVEADHIRRVLAATEGQINQAAATLGIHRNTLARKVKEYGIVLEPADGGAA